MNEAELILKLNSELEIIKRSLVSLLEKKNVIDEWIKKCDVIIDKSVDYINNIDSESIFGVLEEENLELVNKIKAYQFLSKNENYIWNDSQKDDTINIFKSIKDKLVAKKNKFDEEEVELNKNSNLIQKTINNLNNNFLDKDSYQFLYEFLSKDEDNLENNLKLFMSLSIKYNNSIIIEDDLIDEVDDEIIEEVGVTNLELEKVIEIFKKYGYDFLQFSDEILKGDRKKIDDTEVSPRQYILKLGKYENIEKILDILSRNKINLDISKYSNKLCVIFALSDDEIVQSIIDNINEDMLKTSNSSLQSIFNIFINRPSVFVRGKKRCVTRINPHRVPGPHSPSEDKNLVFGFFENYKENRKLFIEMGIDILSAFDKCCSIFEKKNTTIKKNIQILELYGINRQEYINSLSCLSCDNYRIAFVLDRFIELGNFNFGLEGYNHLKNNLTRVCRETTPLLYKLINASLDGIPIDSLFHYEHTGSKYMSLCTSILNSYPKDAIYLDGEKVPLETCQPKENSKIHDIDFNIYTTNLHRNLFTNYFVRELENFKENDLCYNFNGIIISRYKVLRNINILLVNGMVNAYNVLYAITKDSILTKDQCETIKVCLSNLVKKDVMNYVGGNRR